MNLIYVPDFMENTTTIRHFFLVLRIISFCVFSDTRNSTDLTLGEYLKPFVAPQGAVRNLFENEIKSRCVELQRIVFTRPLLPAPTSA